MVVVVSPPAGDETEETALVPSERRDLPGREWARNNAATPIKMSAAADENRAEPSERSFVRGDKPWTKLQFVGETLRRKIPEALSKDGRGTWL